MELGLFLKGLEESLVKRGISQEVAAKHAAALGRTFTDEDLAEIESIRSPSEIDEIADSIAAILYKNKSARSQPRPAPQPAVEEDMDTDTVYTEEQSLPAERTPVDRIPAENIPTERKMQEKPPQARTTSQPRPEPRPVYAQNSDDFFTAPTGEDKTTKGVAVFWTAFILTLPLTLLILLGVLGIFGGLFLALIVCIIGLVVGMIAVVAAGSGIALVGIIYGITQLFSFMAAGIYEIGLGIMIGGIVLLTGVILYNIAIRFLPWVMKWLTVFFTFVFGQFRNLFYLARRECYKL